MKERCVGAPALRVAGARVAAASNLFRGRDERAQLFGESEHARLFAARHVDDGAAFARFRKVRREFKHRRGGVVRVKIVARLVAPVAGAQIVRDSFSSSTWNGSLAVRSASLTLF